jgi:hypothetical protein
VTIDAPAAGAPDGGGWTLANAVMLDGFAYSHEGIRGRVRLGLVDAAVTRETDERHDTLKTAQEIAPGSIVSGRFLQPGEVDWYRFPARKGEVLWFEAVGERAGLAMDLDAAIHDSRGILVQTFADTAHPREAPARCPLDTLDPMGAWKAPADGAYLLVIRDLYGPSAAGVERTYRLAIGPPREEARVVVLSPDAGAGAPRGISLQPGGSIHLPLVAVRRGGHQAAITVRAEDLPPGLTAPPATIPAGKLEGTLTLTADGEAASWAGLLALWAETAVDGQIQSIPVRGATLVREGKPPVVRLCAGMAAAVTIHGLTRPTPKEP